MFLHSIFILIQESEADEEDEEGEEEEEEEEEVEEEGKPKFVDYL